MTLDTRGGGPQGVRKDWGSVTVSRSGSTPDSNVSGLSSVVKKVRRTRDDRGGVASTT